MSIDIDKVRIISGIKEYYSFDSDADFARFLGISPTTLSSWQSRNTLNWDTIFAKCVDLDFDLLIRERKFAPRGASHTPQKAEPSTKSNESASATIAIEALNMIKDLSAENALLKHQIEEHKRKPRSSYNIAAEP